MAQGRHQTLFGFSPLDAMADEVARAMDLRKSRAADAHARAQAARAGVARQSRASQAQKQQRSVASPSGVRAPQAIPPAGPTTTKPAPKTQVRAPSPLSQVLGAARETADQLGAGANGAFDAATFGVGDKIIAAAVAADAMRRGGDAADHYKAVRKQQLAQDAYDEAHRPLARNIGGAVGTLAPIIATGGLGAAPMVGIRAASYAPRLASLSTRLVKGAGPQAAIAVGGAATSVSGQTAADLAAGKMSSPAAMVSSALGGGLGAFATARGSPQAGAAVQAMVTHSAHRLMTGKPVSVEDMAKDAIVGAALGRFGDQQGRNWSNNLPSSKHNKGGRLTSKEELGETFGRVHTFLRGERTTASQSRRSTTGGTTVVDRITENRFPFLRAIERFNEDKFGYWTRPTKRQLELMAAHPDRYQINRYTPHDVGKATGGVPGLFASQAASREDED